MLWRSLRDLIFITQVVAGLENFVSSSSNKCSNNPEIRIIPQLGKEKALHVLESESEVFIAGRIDVIVECTSSKPIDLDFEGHLALELQQVETLRTTVQDNSTLDKQNECFIIQVNFVSEREATGAYKCWNVGENETAHTSLYVYADGGSPPHLLHADIGNELKVTGESKKEAILPCVVTNPNVPVALYKTTRDGFELVNYGEDLMKYSPKEGFSLNLTAFPDAYGKYKCVAKSENRIHDEVVLQLLEHEKQPKINEKGLLPNIFKNEFSEGRSYQSLVCTDSTGLQMVSTTNCKSVIECRLLEKCMKGKANCVYPCKCANQGQHCSQSLLKHYFNAADTHLGEECETVGKNENGATIHCSRSKYLEGLTFTYFIGLNGQLVSNWRNVPREEILNMSAPEGTIVPYNVGEKIRFICVASRFVFSQGFRWKLFLQNGTLIPANATVSNIRKHDSLVMEDVILHISHPEIEKIVCEAPVWNETDWINSSLAIIVKDTVAPSFFQPENITLHMYPGEKNKTLVCEAQGFPQPDILWYKDGEEVKGDLIFDGTKPNITRAFLTFPEVVDSDHGAVFLCNASNPRGMAFKTFTIHLKVSLWTIVLSTLGAILFVSFIATVIMSVRFFQGGKKLNGYTIHFPHFDIDQFKLGDQDAADMSTDVSEKVFYLPYDEKLFEIPENNLEIDYESVLGQGEFGIVLKGLMKTGDDEIVPVAVKTLKGYDVNHFKALLSELKIMIYLGGHRNIVHLIGAVTCHLTDRKAFVVVEYCALGNLQEYISQRRTSFLDEFDSMNNARLGGAGVSSYVRFNIAIRTTDLVKWSWEISTAMEYLTSRKIIHGDLALRNVLLDAYQTAKLTDFGLSKQLYKCSSYYLNRSKDVPLPWKWIAPEALAEGHFDIKSDVWSFGVLLWEIFSLGENPYCGINYSLEFLQLIQNGFRLIKPTYCNDDIYKIMRNCWRVEPLIRPSFTELQSDFRLRLPTELIDETAVVTNNPRHLQQNLLV